MVLSGDGLKRRWSRFFVEFKPVHIIDLFRQYGALRGIAILLGILVPIATLVTLQISLSEKVGWPDAYGFQCRGRGCFLTNLWHSPALLENGGLYEIGLFAVLWTVPVITAIAGVLLVRARKKRAARIRPLKG